MDVEDLVFILSADIQRADGTGADRRPHPGPGRAQDHIWQTARHLRCTPETQRRSGNTAE